MLATSNWLAVIVKTVALWLQVGSIAAGIPSASVAQVLVALASYLTDSPHLEFMLGWLKHICIRHGRTLQNEKASVVMPAIRAMQKVLSKTHEDLSAACDSNLYTLQYLCATKPVQSESKTA